MQQTGFEPIPTALKLLVGVIVAIELMLQLSGTGMLGLEPQREAAFLYGAFWGPLFSGEWPAFYSGQRYIMFVSHAFLHANLLHMAMNTVVILALGKRLSAMIGGRNILILFAVSAAGGGLGFGLLNSAPYPMIGASGAVFGFFGLWKYFEFLALRQLGRSVMPVVQFIGVLVVINVLLMVTLGGGLAWEAHLGGFIAGGLMGAFMTRPRRQRR